MADVFVIAGSTVDMDAQDCIPTRFHEEFGTIPELTLQRRGIALAASDPWVGKSITWTSAGTLRLTGDIVSANPHFDERLGWVVSYQCLGLRNRLDWIPHTDSATGIQISPYNLLLQDPSYNASRVGRTVAQILTDVLQMSTNAGPMTALGIGGYTVSGGGTIYTLPSTTTTDLAALTVVPPRPVYFTGEKLGSALDGFLAQWAPNYRMWIRPDGVIRFLDLRTFSATTLTMGTDPIEPAELSRDAGACFERVVVRGLPISIMALLKLSLGQITEDFGHDGLTNSAAKAAWTVDDFHQPGTALSQGTCTCPSTTTITLTSSVSTESWSTGYWDQSHQQGTINLYSSVLGTSYVQCWSARVVTCPALTAAGTCTVTIDNPLPSTAYDHYTISGLATGGSVVWTRYAIANSALWPRINNQSTYPQAFINGGGGASMLSSPMGVIYRTGNITFPLAFTFNNATGSLRFIAPTWIVANNAAPTDVWVYLPVYTDALQAIQPPDSGGSPVYAGTSNSVEGLTKTLTVTVDAWSDPGQIAQMLTYASDLLDSVKDTVVEGSVVYYDLYAPALAFGVALSIAGNDGAGAYPTPWSGLSLPVRAVELEWPQSGGLAYRTTMHVSNRRAVYDAGQFLKPPRQVGYSFGMEGGVFSPMGGAAFGRADISSMMGNMPASASPFEGTGGIDRTAYSPEALGLPTSPGEYLRAQGAPMSVAETGVQMPGPGPGQAPGGLSSSSGAGPGPAPSRNGGTPPGWTDQNEADFRLFTGDES